MDTSGENVTHNNKLESSISNTGKNAEKNSENELYIKKNKNDDITSQVNPDVTPKSRRRKGKGPQLKGNSSSNLKTHSAHTPSTATTAPLTDGGSIESNTPNLLHSPHQQYWPMYRFMENSFTSPRPLPPYSAATMSSSKNQTNYHILHNTPGMYLGAISPNAMLTPHNTSHKQTNLTSKLKDNVGALVSGQKEEPSILSNEIVPDYHVTLSTPMSITNIPKRSLPEYNTKTPPIPKKHKRSRKERKSMPPLYSNKVIYATPHKELELDRLPKNLDLTPTAPSTTTSSIMHLQSSFEKNTGSKTKKKSDDLHCKNLFASNQFEQPDLKDHPT